MKQTILGFILILTGCATGSHIITGTARPVFPSESVKLYASPPANFETIGIVTATLTGADSQRASDLRVAELKKQAGMIGANGVLLGMQTPTPPQSTYIYNPYGGMFITSQNGATINGTAIFVTQTNN